MRLTRAIAIDVTEADVIGACAVVAILGAALWLIARELRRR